MDTKFKKTALGDDAMIYQKSKDTISKEELRNLPLKQKLGYFRDYYLKIVIVIVIAAIFLVSILNTTIFNRSESVLSLCFLSNSLPAQYEELNHYLEGYVEFNNKRDYVGSEAYLPGDYQMDMAFTTKVMAGAIDLIICPAEDFPEQAERGMFRDLSEFLPADLYEQLSDRILEQPVAEYSDDGKTVSYTDPIPMGIDLTDSSLYQEYGGTSSQPILCVAGNVQNAENAIRAIECFLGISISEPVDEP